MSLYKEYDIGKLVDWMEKREIKVDDNTKKILDFFNKYTVTYSAYSSSKRDTLKCISGILKIKESKLIKIIDLLEDMYVLENKKFSESEEDIELYFGFTDFAKNIYRVK